ncbi:hypothetical protein SAMN04487968_101353 [Nocardioides terrae]|uniref:Uncharacterized protein n=1 Tax=Nocardioides terrae TaxID=574651 RepID=A0A1I1DT54_9ACTN|nr:hypothetical protein [Nocardioides terrae]SFB75910.1 hypothetical protein SAMN04487968_101353 [Nocardioides terrae]
MTHQPVPVVGCPDCSTPITPGADRCRSCGLLLLGPTAARLWQVDQQLTALHAERGRLLTDLRARSGLGAAAPASSAELPTAGGLPKYPIPALRPCRPAGRGLDIGAQRLILGTGAALVLVAAIVFAAVAWTSLPVVGQAALMVAATAVTAAAAARVASRGLRGSAETLAAVTVGLLLVDIAAARTLGVAGLGSVDAAWYATAGAAVAAAVIAGLVRAGSTDAPRLYAWAAVACAAAVPSLAAAAADVSTVVFAVVALGAAAAFGAASDRMPGRWATAAPGAVIVATAYLATGTAVGILGSFLRPLLGEPGERESSAVAFAVVALAAAGLLRVRTASVRSALVRATPVLVAGAAGLGLCSHSRYGVLALSLLGSAVAAGAAAASGRSAHDPRPATGRTLVAGHGVAAAALGVFAAQTADGLFGNVSSGQLDVRLLAAGLVAIAGAAALTAVLVPVAAGARAGLTAYAGTAVLLAAGLAVSPAHDRLLSTVAVLVVSLAIAATAAWRYGTSDEPLLGLVAAGGFLAAAAIGSDDATTLALVTASAGLLCLAYAALPARGFLAAGGVAGCSLAVWLLLADAGVAVVEAYSLPLAVLAGAVGAVRLVREPRAPSWATVGPAVMAGLLPSAIAAVGDDGLVRPLAVLVAGAAVVAAGLRLRWQAPVVLATLALLVVAVSQLAPYAVGVPRWLSLGGVGVVLLVLGIRYEQTREAAVGMARWAHRLR